MLIVFIRTMLMYFIVLFIIRMMGKAELSKMSPFQMVVVFMIAELASIPIESPEVSMITGITAIITLMFLQILISNLSLRSEILKKIFSGKPSVLIDKGSINFKELKSLRITVNDLMEQLRLCNAPAISDVEYAVMESNGDLSVILKPDAKPVTAQDLSIIKQQEIMPSVIVSDGVLYNNNLYTAGWNESELSDHLIKIGLSDYKDAFLIFCDSSSKLHVYINDKNTGQASEVTI